MAWTGTARHRGDISARRRPSGPDAVRMASKSLKKTPSAFSDQDESRRWRKEGRGPRTLEVLLLIFSDLFLQIFRKFLRPLIQRVVVPQIFVHRISGVI